MASKIEFITIDEKFPVAGQDNDSQGFRDNFDVIKKSLQDANEEVTDLQDNAARKDTDNEFAGNSLVDVNLKNFTQQLATGQGQQTVPEVSGVPQVIDVQEGQYFAYAVTESMTFQLKDFPGSDLEESDRNFSSIIVELRADYESNTDGTPTVYDVTFQVDAAGDESLKKGPDAIWREPFETSSVTARIGRTDEVPLTADSTEDVQVHRFEFSTRDGGKNVFARYIGTFDVTGVPTAGGGQTRIDFLGDIGDVNVDTVADGDTIIWNAVDEVWEPGAGGGGAEEIVIASETADFVLDVDDINKYIRVTSFGTVDVTVPAGTTEIEIGSSVTFFQNGVGVVQIVPDEGVIVNSSSGFLTTRDQYSAMTLTKIAENEWDLIGDIAAFVFVCGVSWLALGVDQFAPKQVLIGDTAPVEGTYDLFGTDGSQMLHLVDPYGNAVDGSFSFVEETGQTVATFGTSAEKHDLLFWIVDDSVPANYYTTGTEFASDEAVIYFRPNFASGSIPEANYTFKLVFRDPNAYASFGPANVASQQTLTVTAADYDANPDAVYAIPFPEPGAFNGITVEGVDIGGTILDFRLCKDFTQQAWPFNTPIPIGTIPDDPIIITNFTGEASTNTGVNLI